MLQLCQIFYETEFAESDMYMQKISKVRYHLPRHTLISNVHVHVHVY